MRTTEQESETAGREIRKKKDYAAARGRESGSDRDKRGERRGYKTAVITQHVLWTDGGE